MKRVYEFIPCSSTAGKPFDDSPKCPLFIKCDKHLSSKNWNMTFYNSFKTATGDLCNTKYKRLDESEEIMSVLEICIEGTHKICSLTALVSTYHPSDIMRSLDHKSEGEVIKDLDTFFEGHALKK